MAWHPEKGPSAKLSPPPAKLNPAEIGLFLDVDGTLLDIAPRPEAVRVEPGLREDLTAVEAATGGALALVSGRPIAELDRIFAPLRLAAGGTHGAELRRRADHPVVLQAAGRLGEDAWNALCEILPEFPGSYAENKGFSFAVHYADPGTDLARLRHALADLLERVAAPDKPLRLIGGKAVFEIQLGGFDKGRAIGWFMREKPFLGRRPVFIGDDEIDRPAFDAVLAMGGFAFWVGAERPGFSGAFPAPDAVRAWLHDLVR